MVFSLQNELGGLATLRLSPWHHWGGGPASADTGPGESGAAMRGDSCLSPASYLDAPLPADLSSPLLPHVLWFGQPFPTASPFPSLPPAGMCSPPLVKPQPDCGLLHDPGWLPRAPAAFPRHPVYVAFNMCCLLLLIFLEQYRLLDQCRPVGLSMVMNAVQRSNHWPCVAVDSWQCGSGNRASGFLMFSSLMNLKSSSHRR